MRETMQDLRRRLALKEDAIRKLVAEVDQRMCSQGQAERARIAAQADLNKSQERCAALCKDLEAARGQLSRCGTLIRDMRGAMRSLMTSYEII